MKRYEFDEQFQHYIERWFEEHQKEYRDFDQMEEAMPALYEQWLQTPAPWLGGEKPGQYFLQFRDVNMLIGHMLDYFDNGGTPPDPLLDAIADHEDSSGPLMDLLTQPILSQEVRLTAANLLVQQAQQTDADRVLAIMAADEDDEVAQVLAQVLIAHGQPNIERIMQAIHDSAFHKKAELFASVMMEMPKSEPFFQWLLEAFAHTQDKALYAAYLGSYGDERALLVLQKALMDPIDYLTFIELRNAIEMLGGQVDIQGDFTGDPGYEAMCRLEDDILRRIE